MKRLLSFAIALMLCIVACFSLVACSDKDTGEDLVSVTVKVKIYNGTAAAKEVELSYTLYRHLAPDSVGQFIELAQEDYYDGSIYYEMGMSAASGIKLVGNYEYANVDGKNVVVAKQDVETIDGEFAKGGTTGSDLKTAKGSICLWRWWSTVSGNDNTTSGFNSGSAGMLAIPTRTGLFLDKENSSTLVAVAGILGNDEDTQNGFKWIIGETVDDVTYSNWSNDNTITYHVFYYLDEDGNMSAKQVMDSDTYKAEVTDGDIEVFDPSDKDAPAEYKSSKYIATTITVPKYEYRIVIEDVVIND